MFHITKRSRRALATVAVAGALLGLGILHAADHADAPDTSQGNLDINDLYVFASGNNMVFAMTVSPLLAPGSATTNAAFNPNGLYQFKMDTDMDGREDGVVQITFDGSGTGQTVQISGPAAPGVTGAVGNVLLGGTPRTGAFNTTFSSGGMTMFAGPREDPFFIHLFGDSSLTSVLNAEFDVGSPKTLGFSNPGVDDLAGLNVLAIVVEIPKADLASALGISTSSGISVWATASIKN